MTNAEEKQFYEDAYNRCGDSIDSIGNDHSELAGIIVFVASLIVFMMVIPFASAFIGAIVFVCNHFLHISAAFFIACVIALVKCS